MTEPRHPAQQPPEPITFPLPTQDPAQPPAKTSRNRVHKWGYPIVALVAFGLGSAGNGDPVDPTATAAATKPAASTAVAQPAATTAEPVEPVKAAATTKPPAPKPAPKPKPVTYRKLTARQWSKVAKNPDGHLGEHYVVYGYVTQADSATGTDTLRADLDGVRHGGEYGYLDYDTNTVLQQGKASFDDVVENDIFEARVSVMGSLEYETTLGGKLTAPVLEVDRIKVTGSTK